MLCAGQLVPILLSVLPAPPASAFLPAGHLEPTAGESRRSHKLRIGRYNQHFVDALAFDENPVEYLMNKFPEAGLKPEGMRAMLGRFGLSGHHHLTPIVKLSGGCQGRERVRGGTARPAFCRVSSSSQGGLGSTAGLITQPVTCQSVEPVAACCVLQHQSELH